jgi:hypothetical protein
MPLLLPVTRAILPEKSIVFFLVFELKVELKVEIEIKIKLVVSIIPLKRAYGE